jgi:hypothetical protein
LSPSAEQAHRYAGTRGSARPASCPLMAIELVLEASVSLPWFLKETPDRAAYAAAINAVAADGAVFARARTVGNRGGARVTPRVQAQGVEAREAAPGARGLGELRSPDAPSAERRTPGRRSRSAERCHHQGCDALCFDLARVLKLPLARLDAGHRHAAKLHRVTLFTPE